MSTVVLLADTYLIRNGLVSVIEKNRNFEAVVSTDNAAQFEKELDRAQPDIAIIEHDGFLSADNKTVAKWMGQSKLTKFLVVTALLEKPVIQNLLKSGVQSILTKHCEEPEILSALTHLKSGKKFLCGKILEVVIHAEVESNQVPTGTLTKREVEIVQLIAAGKSSHQIADELFLSVHTINSHRKNILKKLNLKSPTQLIVYAFEHKIA